MCADDAASAGEGYPDTLQHIPVMLDEVLHYLNPTPGETICDCTLGGGSYALAICERIGPTGRLIGIDRDEMALAYAARRLRGYPVTLCHNNFADLDNCISALGLSGVDGFVFDLGLSSLQLDSAERGFSFKENAPLDLRQDRRNPLTAADVVATLSEEELGNIFRQAGYDTRWARRLARAIVSSRQRSPIRTTHDLVALVEATIPAGVRSRSHVATLAFLGLRMYVNQEIESLIAALDNAVRYSNTTARIVVITFNSLEDATVKHSFNRLAGKPPPIAGPYAPDVPPPPRLVTILTPKPVVVTPDEARRNRRARSARLRAVEKL
jgi:16S rRNA (cytosine1402-N4)-methyltransferase